jgi:hypothetical protein
MKEMPNVFSVSGDRVDWDGSILAIMNTSYKAGRTQAALMTRRQAKIGRKGRSAVRRVDR